MKESQEPFLYLVFSSLDASYSRVQNSIEMLFWAGKMIPHMKPKVVFIGKEQISLKKKKIKIKMADSKKQSFFSANSQYFFAKMLGIGLSKEVL